MPAHKPHKPPPPSTEAPDWFTGWGFENPRMVAGVLCATQDYIATRAVVVGCHPQGFERRYCYENRAQAFAALAAYKDPRCHPPGQWIKVKGYFRGKPIDALNPRWSEVRPWDVVAPEAPDGA